MRGSSQTNPETYFGQIKGYVTDLFANHTSETNPESNFDQIKAYVTDLFENHRSESMPESYKEQIKTYVTDIINNDNIALKLLVFICLFSWSSCLMPLNSILIK